MVDWSIAQQPSAFEREFQGGFQQAEYFRQRREQTNQRNALAAYAANPGDQTFNALAQAAPEYAIQVRGQRDQASRDAMMQDLRRSAAGGNPAAMRELAAADPTAYNTISDNRRDEESDMVSSVSNVAQRILTMPENERSAAFDQQMQFLSQRHPELAQYIGQYSDDLMHSTIAEAGQYDQYRQATRPQPFNVGPGEGRYEQDPRTGQIRPVVLPNTIGAPAFSPAPPPPEPPPPSGGTVYPIGMWQTYTRAVGQALPAFVERDHPIIVNSRGYQVQTDVLNGQIAYNVNGVWYDNPEGE